MSREQKCTDQVTTPTNSNTNKAMAACGRRLIDCLRGKWLICVYYYSDHFEIEKMDNETHGAEVIRQTKKSYSVHGIPEKLTSDKGPPWNGAEFKEFSQDYGFEPNCISLTHSQSNGKVEKSMDIAKNMLKKCQLTHTDPYLALLNIQNTSREEVDCPAHRLF